MKPNVQKGVPILSTNILTSWICAELEVLIQHQLQRSSVSSASDLASLDHGADSVGF